MPYSKLNQKFNKKTQKEDLKTTKQSIIHENTILQMKHKSRYNQFI